MSNSRPASSRKGSKLKRDSYHRGNVREDLISLGRDILESEGIEAITLRRLTREIGVNPTNFYNHFPNMDYLLAAIKVEGHQEVQARYRKATEKSADKREALRALCHEYVFFAIENPNLYRLMFDHLHDYDTHQELKATSDRTMAIVVENLYGSDIFDDTEPMEFYRSHPLVVACWSLFHGLSHILIERQIRIPLRSRKDVIKFIDDSMNSLLDGIAGQLDG